MRSSGGSWLLKTVVVLGLTIFFLLLSAIVLPPHGSGAMSDDGPAAAGNSLPR